MQLDLALFAEAANTTAEAKLNILGEFNMLQAPSTPAGLPQATLVLRVVGTAAEQGTHQLTLGLRDDDGNLIWSSQPLSFQLGPIQVPGLPLRAHILIQLGPFGFNEFGSYAYEVIVDGQRLGEASIHVVQIPAPGPQSS